jgi:hypothetical protein
MSDTPTETGDLLGLKPFGEAIKIGTQGAVDAAAAFLGRLCLPATEEFGLMLRDRVGEWRKGNAVRLAAKAEEKVNQFGYQTLHAHPRLVSEALEKGSWHSEDIFLAAWAGLLCSSCSEDGADDSNVLFIGLLSQLTGSQVRLLAYACDKSERFVSDAGWPYSSPLPIEAEALANVTGVSDFQRLDRELDHLSSLGLIASLHGGFDPRFQRADVSPSGLAMHLYIRCQGFIGSPIEYWGLQRDPKRPPLPEDE